MLLSAAVVAQILEIGAWTGIYTKLRRAKTRQLLIHGKPQPFQTPVLDRKLEAMTGRPTGFDRFLAKKVIAASRFAVHTRAFEHCVMGLVNHKSEWYKNNFPKIPTKLRILN
jgi:hypothetical protein